ncbi:MAG: diguanylate cyclase [Pseudomonadales bacterium]|uniref:diguanylate cyclase n=1 Tax=Oleiphilus messinensis TaxID=141451 RepID=A0A1Y0IH78_9GAMM|nr:diguanylate cyclase [Oleiphilus messinensis]ARU58744.1 response regulator receiver-modulated signal transduction diguanylate cyclase [Oleiphilus messinensis]MCG8611431.1 diguanylate cyclase [Pseudomonadales bacterium]
MKVLVVEDSKSVRSLIAAYVEEAGHKAIPCGSGTDALAFIESEPVDLILMDVEMPGLDGYETTRRIRSRNKEIWFPIVFLSSKYSSSDFVEGVNAGGDAYLAKPVNGPVLQAMVRAMGRIAQAQEQLQAAKLELERVATHDTLTGTMNRRGFLSVLEREWRRGKRESFPMSLIVLAVDAFKSYNDNYGLANGDKCLKFITDCIQRSVLRPADLVGRIGDEEFAIMLPNTELAGAVDVAERIRQNILKAAREHRYSPVAEVVTASLGVASQVEGLADPEVLFKDANGCLSKAKQEGRNRVVANFQHS